MRTEFVWGVVTFLFSIVTIGASLYVTRFQLRVGRFDSLSATILFAVCILYSAFPAAYVFRLVRTWCRAKYSQCLRCGYNLTGNRSGTCPECGERIPSSHIASSPQQHPVATRNGARRVKRRMWISISVVVLVILASLWIQAFRVSNYVILEDFAVAKPPLEFARWSRASGLAEVEPNDVFLIHRKEAIIASITFASSDMRVIDQISINDGNGSTWIWAKPPKRTFDVLVPSEGGGRQDRDIISDTDGDGYQDEVRLTIGKQVRTRHVNCFPEANGPSEDDASAGEENTP